MENVLTFTIVSAALSLLVQWIKIAAGTSGWKTQAILIGVSLLGGLAYYFFSTHQNYWLVVGKLVAYADLIYTFVISKLETQTPAV